MHDLTLDADRPRRASSPAERMEGSDIDESREIARLAQENKRLSEHLAGESQKATPSVRAAGYRWLPRAA
jgi:hypothetical protein